jgi:hypothetical protein
MVTRLGEYRPLGNCFPWAVFLKITYSCNPNLGFTTEKVMHFFDRKWGALYCGRFFTNSSGHQCDQIRAGFEPSSFVSEANAMFTAPRRHPR